MGQKDYSNLGKEELLQIIRRLESRKKYGLVWDEEQTKERFEAESENALPVLREVKSKDIITDPSKPMNILIEGDNYHALSTLNYTHHERIDLIYIDPPYNTKNKEFKYNDTYIDGSDSYRHSKWLSFMHKRLRLAKNLLKSSGAIFISINEEEFAHLKILCDEVFGEKNYLTTFTVKVRHEDRILKGDKDFHEVVEYLLLYRKSDQFKPRKRQRDNTSNSSYVYEVRELVKKPRTAIIGNKKVEIFKSGEFEVVKGDPNVSKFKKINIRGSIKEGNSSGRYYVKHLEYLSDQSMGYLYKVEGIGADDLGYRYFLMPKSKNKLNGDYFQGVPVDREDIKEYPYPNYFDFEEDFNSVGYEGGVDFRNGKKPIAFIQKIFEIADCFKKDALVLDFFAGSGSTGHAVLDWNKNENGTMKFILCTNNEMDCKSEMQLIGDGVRKGSEEYEREGICQKITYPRIRKVIRGYQDPKGKAIGGLGGNLKYFKTNFVKRSAGKDTLKIRITRECTEMLCLREGIFGEKKKSNDYQIFEQKDRVMAVYYSLDRDELKSLKRDLDKIKGQKILYCFSLDPLGLDKNDFGDWRGISLLEIPQKILEIYEAVYDY